MLVRPEVTHCVSRSIIITGAARSGTTMMGTLLHTLEGVEYVFEPPFMFSLLPLVDSIPDAEFRLLYETYLYEEFLMEAVAGRRINLNRNDLSYIARAKSDSEVDSRLTSRYRRADLFALSQRRRVCFKIPDLLPFLPQLQKLYPDTRIVVMFREPEAVVASLLSRGWYQENIETSRVIQGPWKLLQPDVPCWVKDEDDVAFINGTELERAYLYYLTMYSVLDQLPNALVVDYNQFIKDPEEQFARVCGYVQEHKFTPITALRLGEVREREDVPPQSLGQLRPELRERVVSLIDRIGEKACAST